MATNKFATMLHRNTHKLTVILVYAVLEWILIFLLLINSLFSYLITKFANYFGLKRPCLWCSRVDHVLEPGKNIHSYRDLVCEIHATEISRLGYCSHHQRLVEQQSMCMDCLASRPTPSDESMGMTRRIAFISWVSKETTETNGENIFRCSCCSESLNGKLYPPYLLIKPSWGALKYTQRGNLVAEAIEDDNSRNECKEASKTDSLARFPTNEDGIERINEEEHHDVGMAKDEHQILPDDAAEEDHMTSESNLQLQCDREEGEENHEAGIPELRKSEFYGRMSVHPSSDDTVTRCCFEKDISVEIHHLCLERTPDCQSNRLIPLELIDSSTSANYETYDYGLYHFKEDDLEKQEQNGTLNSASGVDNQDEVPEEAVHINEDKEKNSAKVECIEIDEGDGENHLIAESCKEATSLQAAETPSNAGHSAKVAEMEEIYNLPAQEEEVDYIESSVDPTTYMPSTEPHTHSRGQPEAQQSTPPVPCLQGDCSSTNASGDEILDVPETHAAHNELDPNSREKSPAGEKMVSPNTIQAAISHHTVTNSEANEAEDEKFPETPTSVDSVQYLNKKLPLYEKRESGTEDSLDESVVNEIDARDPVLTIERLKTALKAERKAMGALYAELEEERSASAIATNQTMAMINRLQEEKAAMQMEALQYQRMMEEQSEYDQEALQLLNELMVKREREKQELEKELEVYRKKVSEFEAKEKARMMRRIKDGSIRSRNSSTTCSNAEDIDALSIDINREAQDENGSFCGNQETPDDEVRNLQEIALDCVKQMTVLDDSMAEFEEERLSILDQLKVLEEKLLNLGDSEFIDGVNSIENHSNFNAKVLDESYDSSTPEESGVPNELSDNKYYPDRKTMSSMAKNLLPLLDVVGNETEEGFPFEENVQSEIVEMENATHSRFELDGKRLAIEEEVDHVYERLQALEADREFLKHCMSSIKKGDKGMDLLQEILQHLRDLRAVELRTRNLTDDSLG